MNCEDANISIKFLNEEYGFVYESISRSKKPNEIRSKYKEIKRHVDICMASGLDSMLIRPAHVLLDDLQSHVIRKLSDLEELIPYKYIIKDILYRTENINPSMWKLYYTKRPTFCTEFEYIVNEKLRNNVTCDEYDYLFLFKNNGLTEYGYDHFYDILEALSLYLSSNYSNDDDVFKKFYLQKPKKYRHIEFSKSKTLNKKVISINRKIENEVRKKNSVNPIGKAWVSENKLYEQVKRQFRGMKVIQHARYKFLGKQHLDIFIPELKIAVEFQGEQHFKSIDYFGGEEAFIRNRERDIRKYKICKENNIEIIYVTRDYLINDVIHTIMVKSKHFL